MVSCNCGLDLTLFRSCKRDRWHWQRFQPIRWCWGSSSGHRSADLGPSIGWWCPPRSGTVHQHRKTGPSAPPGTRTVPGWSWALLLPVSSLVSLWRFDITDLSSRVLASLALPRSNKNKWLDKRKLISQRCVFTLIIDPNGLVAERCYLSTSSYHNWLRTVINYAETLVVISSLSMVLLAPETITRWLNSPTFIGSIQLIQPLIICIQ